MSTQPFPATTDHQPSMSASSRPVSTRRCNIVVCIVSSHGLVSLLQVLQAVRPPFPVPVLIVPDRFTTLPDSLRFVIEEHSLLQVKVASEGEVPSPGSIYLVPAHAAVTIAGDQRFSVSTDPSSRTSDPTGRLLSSVARAYDGRVATLVLTSATITSTDAVRLLRERGGLVLTAEDFEIETPDEDADCDKCVVDYWLPRETIAPVLDSLVLERISMRESPASDGCRAFA
jgi:Chemotaxis response regulator containing a CheY-like receiver domain and a methylesterase domain